MLNISKNDISKRLDILKLKSFKQIGYYHKSTKLLKTSFIFLIGVTVVSFFPWTQNIVSESYVTTLQPNKRPQHINSVIAGRVEKWYVKEGSFVKKGDTIIHLSEVKDRYFDPNLILRTQEQIDAKKNSLQSYQNNIENVDAQRAAVEQMRDLKISQAKNKLLQANVQINSDSVRLDASRVNLKIAKEQLERYQKLNEKGLKSLNDLEQKKAKYQEEQAKVIEHENMLLQRKNEKLNVQIEIIKLNNDFEASLATINAKRQAVVSKMMKTKVDLSSLENQLKNYEIRSDYNYLKAPQDGYITKINKAGIGEVFKEGQSIATIMPNDYDYALEMYVRPIDLPLIKKGSLVRISFDGWPSFIITGWPRISFGTYSGEIVAVDRFTSNNGLYRIMVAPMKGTEPWPGNLKVGTGAETIAMLNQVPAWYEFWRQLNGFPPNYYEGRVSIKAKQQNLMKHNE